MKTILQCKDNLILYFWYQNVFDTKTECYSEMVELRDVLLCGTKIEYNAGMLGFRNVMLCICEH